MKVKVIQTVLKTEGLYLYKIDGDFGPKTRAAIRAYYEFPTNWSDIRLTTGAIQVICIRAGFKVGIIDGRWGRKTQGGYDLLLKSLKQNVSGVKVNNTVKVKKTYNDWPRQRYADMVKYYGKVGTNQTSLTLPYNMVLAWDTDKVIKKMSCHEKVHDSLERIFKNVLDHYGMDAIKKLHLNYFGGCLNVRKMRGGSSWSMHSWGCAVDIDPDRNRLRWRSDKAMLARPEYEPFWKIVEAEGATSLGRARGYDYMHFQFADL